MIEAIIFKGAEYACNTTPNTFTVSSNGTYMAPANVNGAVKMVMRIVNNLGTPVIISLTNTTFSGNLTMTGNSVIFLQKLAADTCSSNVAGAGVFTGVVGYNY